MPRRYETLELIRQKVSMSQQIVASKDPDYGQYSGASINIASKMALIDTLLKENVFPEQIKPMILFYRSFLDQQRKAFFSSVASEITKLGFILGLTHESKSASNE